MKSPLALLSCTAAGALACSGHANDAAAALESAETTATSSHPATGYLVRRETHDGVETWHFASCNAGAVDVGQGKPVGVSTRACFDERESDYGIGFGAIAWLDEDAGTVRGDAIVPATLIRHPEDKTAYQRLYGNDRVCEAWEDESLAYLFVHQTVALSLAGNLPAGIRAPTLGPLLAWMYALDRSLIPIEPPPPGRLTGTFYDRDNVRAPLLLLTPERSRTLFYQAIQLVPSSQQAAYDSAWRGAFAYSENQPSQALAVITEVGSLALSCNMLAANAEPLERHQEFLRCAAGNPSHVQVESQRQQLLRDGLLVDLPACAPYNTMVLALPSVTQLPLVGEGPSNRFCPFGKMTRVAYARWVFSLFGEEATLQSARSVMTRARQTHLLSSAEGANLPLRRGEMIDGLQGYLLQRPSQTIAMAARFKTEATDPAYVTRRTSLSAEERGRFVYRSEIVPLVIKALMLATPQDSTLRQRWPNLPDVPMPGLLRP